MCCLSPRSVTPEVGGEEAAPFGKTPPVRFRLVQEAKTLQVVVVKQRRVCPQKNIVGKNRENAVCGTPPCPPPCAFGFSVSESYGGVSI